MFVLTGSASSSPRNILIQLQPNLPTLPNVSVPPPLGILLRSDVLASLEHTWGS